MSQSLSGLIGPNMLIEACNRLSKYTRDEIDKKVIEKEIAELKMSLDLIN
jgi:hypothetical protein